MPLFTGGRITQTIRASDRERAAAAGDVAAGEADLLLEVTEAYWSLVTARENERVLQQALAAYDSHLTDARNRQQVGMAAENEVLSVAVERERTELSRLQAVSAFDNAEDNLRRLLDLPDRTAVAAADPLNEAPPGPPEEDLARSALASRPERAALAGRAAAADLRARAEQGARWPQLNASAAYDYARPNPRITPPRDAWKNTWNASINLSMDLFDFGRTSAVEARASSQARALHRQLDDLDGRIKLEVRIRERDLRTAAQALAVARQALDSATENRRVARDRYREGVGSSSDLLDAETVLLRAGLELTDAQVRLRLAQANLDRAIGREP